MFDLVPDVGGGDVVVEPLGVVADDDLALALALVLPLYELLLDVVVPERLHEGAELLLLVVPGRAAGVYEDGGRDDGGEHFGLFELALVDVEHDEQVEVDALVVVGGRGELDRREIDLPVDHLHLALPSDPHVYQRHPVGLLVLRVFLDREDLGVEVARGEKKIPSAFVLDLDEGGGTSRRREMLGIFHDLCQFHPRSLEYCRLFSVSM